MKTITTLNRSIITLLLLTVFSSCKKYLEKKTDDKFIVPVSISDCQSLLDFDNFISFSDPSVGESSSDDYYMTDESWASLSRETDRRQYTWQKDYLFMNTNSGTNDWLHSYRATNYINVALETLNNIDRNVTNQSEWDNVYGQALFLRAKTFFQSLLIWSLAYDPATASTDLGIPLRLNSNFNESSTRPSVQACYDKIIEDLKVATDKLPNYPLHVRRASKGAAYGLLSRVYLSMRNYEESLKYADLCLQLNNKLMDYNNDDEIVRFPEYSFKRFNKEIIMSFQLYVPSNVWRGYVDTLLYKLYNENDLRKTLFFNKAEDQIGLFKGNYEGADNYFSGIAVDEMLITRSECHARRGNVATALNDLNALMVKRYKTGTFTPYSATNPTELLKIVLVERRKELVYRGLRWMDLKRLNKEGANITLTRKLNGQTFTLPPNDLRYALPIPEDVIQLSGMPQNPR